MTSALVGPRGAARTRPGPPGGTSYRPVPGIVMLLANLDGSVGGAQRQASLLAGEVARRGFPVVVVNQSPRPLARRRTRDDGVERVALPVLGRRAARWAFLLSFLAWAAANRRRFDVIHAHGTSGGLTAGLVGALLGKDVVVKVTGMQSVTALHDWRPGSRLRRWVLDRTATAVVAVSREMLHALARAGVGRGRRVLIPNGVSLTPSDARQREATKAAWLGEHAGPVVLYVGRVTEVKGVRTLLWAWSAMACRQAATLLVVGDGPLRPALEAEAGALGLGGSVRFLGAQPDISPFYLIADVFVLPSESEGLSNALLEAMAAGLPVVASAVGGNRDVIADGASGFLVDWSDVDAVDRLLTTLLLDAGLRARIGEGARRRAAEFSIAAVADRYCDLYRALRAPGAPRPGVAS